MEEKIFTGYTDSSGVEINFRDEVVYHENTYLVIQDKELGWIIHPCSGNPDTNDYELSKVAAELSHMET